MTETQTRAADEAQAAGARAADQPVADGRSGGDAEHEHGATIEVLVPAHELTALKRAAVAHQTPVGDFMATAATYMALGRLELYDEVDTHPDIVALVDAFPEKPPRDSREICETLGQLPPEAIAVLEDPKTRPIDIRPAEHDETVEVRLSRRQLDLLQRATYVAGSDLTRFVLYNADFVALRRLGLIESVRVYPEEAELYGRLCQTPADELARLREVTPATAAVSER